MSHKAMYEASVQGYTQSWLNLRNNLGLTVEQSATNCGIVLDSQEYHFFSSNWDLLLDLKPLACQTEADMPELFDPSTLTEKVVIVYNWYGLMSTDVCEPNGVPVDLDYPEYYSGCLPMCLVEEILPYEEFFRKYG